MGIFRDIIADARPRAKANATQRAAAFVGPEVGSRAPVMPPDVSVPESPPARMPGEAPVDVPNGSASSLEPMRFDTESANDYLEGGEVPGEPVGRRVALPFPGETTGGMIEKSERHPSGPKGKERGNGERLETEKKGTEENVLSTAEDLVIPFDEVDRLAHVRYLSSVSGEPTDHFPENGKTSNREPITDGERENGGAVPQEEERPPSGGHAASPPHPFSDTPGSGTDARIALGNDAARHPSETITESASDDTKPDTAASADDASPYPKSIRPPEAEPVDSRSNPDTHPPGGEPVMRAAHAPNQVEVHGEPRRVASEEFASQRPKIPDQEAAAAPVEALARDIPPWWPGTPIRRSAPEPEPPGVTIGRIDVVVEAPRPASRTQSETPRGDRRTVSRHYLRRL